jgi:hypothetical protein
MAKVAAPASTRPEPKLPKRDREAVLGLHQANLAAAHETQAVLLDAARAIARLQAGHAQALIARARDALAIQAPRQPEAVLGEIKAATGTTFAMARQSLELGVAARRRVAELAAARTCATIERFKTLAA